MAEVDKVKVRCYDCGNEFCVNEGNATVKGGILIVTCSICKQDSFSRVAFTQDEQDIAVGVGAPIGA